MCKSPRRLIFFLILAGFLFAGKPAKAGNYKYDLALQKFFSELPGATNCSVGDPTCQALRNSAWRSLMSQLGVALAPQFLAASETPGWSGFVLDVKYGLTSISDKADYWAHGVNGNPDPIINTVSLEVRKGFWMPLPSFELGGGFTHLIDSHMFTVNVFGKFALHEGFHGWPTPALAVRGYFQRLVGATQVDFTTLSVDVSISKSFGIVSSLNLTPYLGYNALWFIAKSAVIDATPYHDALQCSDGRCDSGGDPWGQALPNGAYCNNSADSDCGAYYVFIDQKAILRHRIFFGLRLYFTVNQTLRLTFATEYSLTIRGLADDSVTISGHEVPLRDDAAMQHTWGVSVGLDY